MVRFHRGIFLGILSRDFYCESRDKTPKSYGICQDILKRATLKICKARSQLRWAWNWLKLNVTSSNVLRIIIHWLSARRDVGLTQGSLIPKEHSLYRALKHSIHQHKLDLNLSKTKQPLPIITNSHLNILRLPPTCKHRTWKSTFFTLDWKPAPQLVGKNLVRQKNSLGTCIPFDIRF